MLDVHPPEHTPHSWRDFFIHIATITIGLFIAIGLEQTVEALHHLHQRRHLEEKLREEFRLNVQKDDEDFRKLADIRAYTLQLKSAVSAQRTGKPALPLPAANDTRRQRVPSAPSLAIWDAAKLDATITFLPSNEIQLYNGLILQHDLTFAALDDFQHSAFAIESFEERFVDSPGAFDLGSPAPLPDIASLSPADLTQYETLLAAYIKAIDRIVVRLHFFDGMTRAILDGATDRRDVLRHVFPNDPDSPAASGATPNIR